MNLDCETRIQTEMRLARAEPDLFDASQKRIEALMEKDPYRRFLRSTLYLKLLDFCQKHEASHLQSNNQKGVESLDIPEGSVCTNSSPPALA